MKNLVIGSVNFVLSDETFKKVSEDLQRKEDENKLREKFSQLFHGTLSESEYDFYSDVYKDMYGVRP